MESPVTDIRIGHLTSQWAENNHLYVNYSAEQESTNAQAKEEAFHESFLQEALCLYVTDHQTAGRGRGKNTWSSRPGTALLSSWSFLINIKPQPTTSCLIGLALYRACSTTWPFLDWNLKAPNDIYIGEKKVAGILLENLMQGEDVRLIVGIGMNIISSPKEVDTSTSLFAALPEGAPLLGQDYMSFLDRLLFELTDAVSHCEELLSSTDRLSLLQALNRHPLLKENYSQLDADGSLWINDKKIHWSEL